MKIPKHLLLLAVALFSWSPAALAAELQLQPGVTFDWWHNRNASASQLTFPLLVTAERDNLSVRLATAYCRTSLSTGSQDVTLDGMLDTKIGATYRLSDKVPFELLLGLDFSLPTGQTGLSADQTRLVMDPDLLPVNTYGEGVNVNPTLTVAKRWGAGIFALGLGYLWRGSYDFNDTLTDYQPGAAFNAHAEGRYYYDSGSYARFFAAYAHFGTDTAEGQDIFKEGDVWQIGASLSHTQTPKLKLSAGLRGIFPGDATVYDRASGASENLSAFNGTEAIFDLGALYALDKNSTLSLPLQFRYMADNGDPPPFHAGAKHKITLGIAAHRALNQVLTLDLALKGYYKHDDATMIPEVSEAATYFSMGVAASLTGRF